VHRKSLLLLDGAVVCCGAKMAKGQLHHEQQMEQTETRVDAEHPP
jgi:hypothetical protein